MNLQALVDGREALLGGMRGLAYSERYILRYDSMISFVLENNRDSWASFEDALAAYEKSGASPSQLHVARSVLYGIERFCKEGALPGGGRRRRPSGGACYDRLNGHFRHVVDVFVGSERARGAKKESTVASEASCAASFLLAMQDAGRACLADVTEEDVLGYLVSGGGPTRSKSYLKSVRTVLATCARSGVGGAETALALIPRPLVRTMPARGLTDAELAAVMGVLRGDGISLRDRAIGLLLATYGLRRSDVSGLTLRDVDLRASLLRVRQRKTGVPVELPLLPEVGNALCDYVSHGRPRCDNDFVFQSLARPYGRLSPGGVYGVATRILDRAGVAAGEGGHRGSHVFRRTVATRLLGGEVARPVISGVLGHEDPRSVEAYVSADVEHLRACALSIEAWPIPEEVFGS
jgi:integrase